MMNNIDFQTPANVADYMASWLPDFPVTILEPTPGAGNLVAACVRKGQTNITAPERFEDLPKGFRSDYAIMNPPFTPMIGAYSYLLQVMQMSDQIIALLPWFTLINSERRMRSIRDFGLISVIHLPRKTFPNCRIQCCIVVLRKGYDCSTRPTSFRHFTW